MTPRKAGRPRMHNKKLRVGVALTPEQLDYVERFANARGLQVSVAVRELVELAKQHHGFKP